MNDSLLATLVLQKILGRDCAHSGCCSRMISLRLLVHNDEALPKLYPTEDFQWLLSEKRTSDFLTLKISSPGKYRLFSNIFLLHEYDG